MTMLADLVAHLKASVPSVSSRVHPLRAPEKFTVPLLVYQVKTTLTDHTFEGVTEFTRTLVQIDVYATTYSAALATTEEVVAAMQAFTNVKAVIFENEIHLEETTVEPNLFRVSMDWRVTHDR